MILIGFAGALRRSELVAIDVEHVAWTRSGMKLLIERSKTDAEVAGPIFRKVNRGCRGRTV